MSKRRAGNELTKDNWDEEEEKVDPGIFKVADESVLKNRVLKRAKRTLQRDESGELKPIFSGFSGFNNLTSNLNSKQAFSFLSKSNDTPSESGNHPSASTINSLTTSSSLTVSESNSSKSSTPPNVNHIMVMKLNEAFVKFITNAVQKNPHCVLTPTLKDYEKKINRFIDISSCKTVTPDSSTGPTEGSPQISVMESKITRTKNSDEVKNNSVNVQGSEASFTNPTGNNSNNEQLLSYGNKSQDTNAKESSSNILKLDNKKVTEHTEKKDVETKLQPSSSEKSKNSLTTHKLGDFKFDKQSLSFCFTGKSPDFKFRDKKAVAAEKPIVCKTLNTKPPFNFGSTLPSFSFKPTEQNSKPFFSFGSKSPTLTVSSENLKKESQKPIDGDEDQPPVVNFTPIKESDAVFESKSKLFCFKNGKYEELGVGQLYLKPVDDKKIQLIMRNDSALGTIMANTLLNESVNFTKRNAKNVQLTCVLDPTKSTKPQTVLFKFKDSQITDTFENELNKLKK
ncbi:nuclear pore complex protein Nup50 [Acyrthosiphon pisum]|uniref:RanBD1 domain-containing protein n=1 Tax=Acyrthosiphon pisum TaxID=7029 RepID=A0A8R1W1S7_ACYPI|nr:nuclear pore complex protein Nup50 [Acyrthosiphon pisum]|eukprot:XP_001945577.1 PREDICTED: nuclear pore complex protein Nup50 [Acyrthosiphon pisum]